MVEDFEDFVVIAPDENTEYSFPTPWLTPEEETSFSAWKDQLKVVVPFWTAVFSALHILSVVFSTLRGTTHTHLKVKDLYQWHNKYAPDVEVMRFVPSNCCPQFLMVPSMQSCRRHPCRSGVCTRGVLDRWQWRTVSDR